MSFLHLLKIKFSILISGCIVIFCIVNTFVGYLFLPGNSNNEKIIIIRPGLSIHEISLLLKKENIICNSQFFKVASVICSYFSQLKSGEYKFIKNISPYQVLNILVRGKSILHKILIPERYTVNQILQVINAEKKLTGKVNVNIAEGYLMPSTYFYSYNDKKEKLIDIMHQGMSNILDELMPKLSKNSPIKTRKEILILASIIEKEASNIQELPKVAAVFINRLKKGMKLQADTTTIYAIAQDLKSFNGNLRGEDMKIRSPYNTYHVYGLPVGPISCPGRRSLEAVVFPAEIHDLYFVADGKGNHYFSKTFKEHKVQINKLKAKLKKELFLNQNK